MQVSRYAVWAETEHGDAVFSGVSGALLPLQPGERRCIETFVATGEPTGVSPERLKELVQARVLVASDRSELETLRARYNRSKYDSAVLSLTLITSLGCNFDCPYCYESKRPSLMNPEVQQAILDMVDDGRSRLTELNVTWMGGEPLVGKNSLYALAEQLIERCDQYGIEYSSDIVTNGWLLDEATAQRLVDLRCTHAQVTIDGPPDLHNSMRPYVGGGPTFDRIVENLTQVADITVVRSTRALDDRFPPSVGGAEADS